MVVKRITLAFNDDEYKKLMEKCSDCRPVVTPYGFIKQLVLNEIEEKQHARENGLEERDEGNNQGRTETREADTGEPPFL